MWISEVAAQAGVNVQTIRYYERRGLLPSSPRHASGYRELPADFVPRIRFIRRAQTLGFSLDEIGEFLTLRSPRRGNRDKVRAVAVRRLRQIERKIDELARMRDALKMLTAQCESGKTLDCPIIESLEAVPEITQ